ncbi:oligosaccharide flippase family protein [Bacteroides sp. AN502(2024)]|uniref:oligosaccharide flippase family protein n=1 Tax=Bacteroides sp. AN502(2024) TaxID=3160599 RepID=UPI003510D7AC
MSELNSRNQLKAGVILNYVVIILNTLVGLLYTPYMLRMMGQNEYGLYSLVASIIAYLTVLDFGFGNAIIRYTAKFRAENKLQEQYEMFGMFLVLYSIIGIIAFVAGLALYFNVDSLFGDTMTFEELVKARKMILLMIANLAITFPLSIYGSIINAYEHFVFPRVINVIRIILNTAIMILLLNLGYKALAMVVLQTVFNVISILLNYAYCKYKLYIKTVFKKFNWSFLKEVAMYSFWIFLFVIMDRIYWGTGQFVLGAVVGTAAVAVYAVAIQLQNMYMQFSNAIASLFLPKVTAMVTSNNNSKEISVLFIKTGRLQYVILAYILTAFLCFGDQFIALWVGPEYHDSFIIAALYFVPLTVPLIQNLGITILQARNQMEFRSILYICIAVISLLLQIVFAKRWGGIGCAYAVSGALIVGQILIMNIYYSKKQQLDIRIFWKEISKMSVIPMVVGSVFTLVLRFYYIDSWMKLFVWISIFSALYIPLFFRFSLHKNERALFLSPFYRIINKI